MPWGRPRTIKQEEMKSLRRHSTIDPTSLDRDDGYRSNHEAGHLGPNNQDTVKSPSPLRKSFEPSTEPEAKAVPLRMQNPDIQDQGPNRQRFSMLRFRHASDPQMSKTARDQAETNRPPLPAGMHGISGPSMALHVLT